VVLESVALLLSDDGCRMSSLDGEGLVAMPLWKAREPFVSYAQNGEDVVLARALQPDRTVGFWVDVGAGDPRFDSVTAAFADRGWRGINIEPLQPEFERLVADRPRDVNLRVALGAAPGVAKLFEGPEENRGSSTMRPEVAARYVENGQVFTPSEVQVMTLAQIVAEYAPPTVDLLKVDVEGMEAEVLAGADWSSFRPRVVVVEATVPNSSEPSYQAWEPMLLELGYQLALFDGLNRFYGRADDPEVLAALSTPANVLDHFVPYVWLNRVNECERWAHSLEAELTSMRSTEVTLAATRLELERTTADYMHAAKEARHARDRAAIAEEAAAVAGDELSAAHRLTSAALGDADELRSLNRVAEMELEELQAELAALRATRTFRYTRPLRQLYHWVRVLRQLIGNRSHLR
jgi:FkbM family methyltransferase